MNLAKYRLVLIVIIVDLALGIISTELTKQAFLNAESFLSEVMLIVPPVMILMGLLDVWVPKDLVEEHLGYGSGVRGAGLAIVLGTAAAGPLYAAFPVALSLQRKGSRLANIAIFLGTWAAIKIPMILMEASFIGVRFALLRLIFTVPGVIMIGYLMERMVPLDEVLNGKAVEQA